MLGPSLSDWPIQSGRSSTLGHPLSDIRSTRYDLALANYLEQQEAHRAEIVASRQAADIRLGLQPLLRLTSLSRSFRLKVVLGWRIAVRSSRRIVDITRVDVFDSVDRINRSGAAPALAADADVLRSVDEIAAACFSVGPVRPDLEKRRL